MMSRDIHLEYVKRRFATGIHYSALFWAILTTACEFSAQPRPGSGVLDQGQSVPDPVLQKDADILSRRDVHNGLDGVLLPDMWTIDEGQDASFADGGPPHLQPTECHDGIDNDGDGHVDLWDSGCRSILDATEGDGADGECVNGLDDDLNGLIDFPEDPNCEGRGDPRERPTERVSVCHNGLDDDDDGAIDYPEDSGCSGRGAGDEHLIGPAPSCANGVDDDEDGLTDFPSDFGCRSASDHSETTRCEILGSPVQLSESGYVRIPIPAIALTDMLSLPCAEQGVDEAKFTLRIPQGVKTLTIQVDHPPLPGRVPSLGVFRACQSTPVMCTTSNDSGALRTTLESPTAGLIIIAVENVQPNSFIRVTQVMHETCANALDDDGDGLVDAMDPGCFTEGHFSEDDPSFVPECANGIDDDGDGSIDYPDDSDCDAAASASESVVCEDIPQPFLMHGQSAVYGLMAGGDGLGLRPTCTQSNQPQGIAQLPLSQESYVEIKLRTNQRFKDSYAAKIDACGETFCLTSDPLSTLTIGQLEAGTHHLVMGTHVDPSPSATYAHVYVQPVSTECSDGIDNDGDGSIDGADLDCTWPRDRTEAGPSERSECSDGIDNDNDGTIDFPDDEGCDAAGDDHEATCQQSQTLWQPVACNALGEMGMVFTTNPVLLTEERASRARSLWGGWSQLVPDVIGECSLDGQGWVSTQTEPIAHCEADWFWFGYALTNGELIVRGAPCLGLDQRPMRRLAKAPNDCWDYTRHPDARLP